jgi:RNA polymerase sigma-70 factor (ECF subfamily)
MIACHSLEDQELLLLIQQDHEAAFEELYRRYWDKLFYLAHKRLRSAIAAEEIVQEVFLAIWQKRKTLVIESAPHYLSAMTRYAVYHYLAKEKKITAHKIYLSKQPEQVQSGEMLVDNKLLLEMVKELARKLPEKCRLVFIYNKIDDQTLTEVAQKLNVSLKTAEAHLTKALRTIRLNMGEQLCWIIQLLPLLYCFFS